MTNETTDRSIMIDGISLDEYRGLGHAIHAAMYALDKLSKGADTEVRRRFYAAASDGLDAILDGMADAFGEACDGRVPYPYPRFRVEGDAIVMEPPAEPDSAPEVDMLRAQADRTLFADDCRARGIELAYSADE